MDEVFTGSSENYVTHTVLFTADSSTSTLKFKNLYDGDSWGNYPRLDNVSVTPAPTPIIIDIKPGSDPNSINPRSKGVIPVAILGSIDFDAMQVDTSTVSFGPNGAPPDHDGHVEDVNDDGFMDMMFHFRTRETGNVCGDTEATLNGDTFEVTPNLEVISITGTDSVNTVGYKGASTEKVDETNSSAGAVSWILLLGLSVVGLLRQNGRR